MLKLRKSIKWRTNWWTFTTLEKIFMTWLLFLSHTYGQVVLYHRHFPLLFVYQSESWSQRSPPLSKPLICTICICIPNTFEKLIIQAWNIVNVIFAILWKVTCIWSSFNINISKHIKRVQKAFMYNKIKEFQVQVLMH